MPAVYAEASAFSNVSVVLLSSAYYGRPVVVSWSMIYLFPVRGGVCDELIENKKFGLTKQEDRSIW